MVVMYFLGTITAFILAKIFNKFLKEASNPSFIMELPSYRIPIIRSVISQVYNRGKLFIVDAGKIIMIISIILWFLVSFPKNDIGEISINNSYAGQIGHAIEPIINPLGFDWKIGISLLTSFAAREVFVGTMSTIYSVGDDDIQSIQERLKNVKNQETGKAFFTPAVGISLMLFYAFAMQCMSTLAIVYRETRHWKWPLIQFLYMGVLAYISSFIAYQLLS